MQAFHGLAAAPPLMGIWGRGRCVSGALGAGDFAFLVGLVMTLY